MKSSFPSQLSISSAVLVLFLLPLLYAGPIEENTDIALPRPEINGCGDYSFKDRIVALDLYSPDDFAVNVVLSESEDLSFALYSDPEYRERIIEYYTSITGSRHIADKLCKEAYSHGVSFSLATSLMWAESKFDPKAYNKNSGSVDRGLFQLNSESFPELSVKNFYDIDTNISKGVAYLQYCLESSDNIIVALAVYNAGHGRVFAAGAPLMSLDHISNILSFREDLERDFERYISRQGKIRVYQKSDKNLIPVVDRKKTLK